MKLERQNMSIGQKMVTVKSLDNVSATYLKSGKEVIFQNGLITLPENEANELLGRPNKRYMKYDPTSPVMTKTPQPSFENLEMEFSGLITDPFKLPNMLAWLRQKVSIVEPMLYEAQLKSGGQFIGQHEAITRANDQRGNILNDGGAQQGSVDEMKVDGDDTVSQAQETLEKAKAALGGKQPEVKTTDPRPTRK